MPVLDEKLKKYATARQWEYYETWCALGTQTAAAEHLGVSERMIQKGVAIMKKRAAKSGYAPGSDLNHPVPEGFSVKGVSDMRTNSEGKPQWVKYDAKKEELEKRLADFVDGLREDVPTADKVVEPEGTDDDILVGYPVGDHHVGLLTWHKDSGGNYDLKIAERSLVSSVDYLVSSAPNATNCLIGFLGDFLHYDSLVAETPTSKNKLDADGRPSKMIHIAAKIMRYTIERAAQKHKNVHVIVEAGNHDPYSSQFLREFMSIIYEDNDRITIDTRSKRYHYYMFGSNMFGTHHGDKVKFQDLPGLMAEDKPVEWGQTKHRYWWTGHIHHERSQEFGSVKVESFRVLPPNDAWHHESGYRSKRGMTSIVYHKDHGEISRTVVTPEMIGV